MSKRSPSASSCSLSRTNSSRKRVRRDSPPVREAVPRAEKRAGFSFSNIRKSYSVNSSSCVIYSPTSQAEIDLKPFPPTIEVPFVPVGPCFWQWAGELAKPVLIISRTGQRLRCIHVVWDEKKMVRIDPLCVRCQSQRVQCVRFVGSRSCVLCRQARQRCQNVFGPRQGTSLVGAEEVADSDTECLRDYAPTTPPTPPNGEGGMVVNVDSSSSFIDAGMRPDLPMLNTEPLGELRYPEPTPSPVLEIPSPNAVAEHLRTFQTKLRSAPAEVRRQALEIFLEYHWAITDALVGSGLAALNSETEEGEPEFGFGR